MFPFVFAFILAIGIPLLPSSFYKALHLPTLRFNFLSAYAPERSFVPSSERPLLEHGYSRGSSVSKESSQFLIVSSPNFPDYEPDSDVLAYMSFTEKLELNYPQTSIWLAICAQLLYQRVEAMVIMTLSFLFATTFLSRRSLSTLIERFCTALFICWHFTPKAALSSFFPDVLLCVHKYWMDNSVTSDQVPTTPTNFTQHDSLGVLADSILSTAPISEGLDLTPLKESNRWSEKSSRVSLITPPRSRETSAPPELALMPLEQPVYPPCTQSTQVKPLLLLTYGPSINVGSHPLGSTTKLSQYGRSSDVLGMPGEHRLLRTTSSSIITNQNFNYAGVGASNSKADLSGTDEVVTKVAAFLGRSSTQDLYSASKRGSTPPSTLALPIEGRDTKAPDAISGSSLVHSTITNISNSLSKPEPDERHAERLRPSSTERFYSGRRRYKSDGIQVRSSRCHLGYPGASPDPAKVDGTCVFWNSAVRHDERGGRAPGKQVLARGFPSESSSLQRISGSAGVSGSVGSPDAALAGIVSTSEGGIMVPASQRADGRYISRLHLFLFLPSDSYMAACCSMRKEIKVRPGHFLREPLAEKYRLPATRVRTSTWDPRLRELWATPPSSPYACNSLPFTPMSVGQRLFGRQCNSPASLAHDWRRLSSTSTVVGTPPQAKGNDACTPLVEKVSSPLAKLRPMSSTKLPKFPASEFSILSETTTIASPMSARAFDNQSSLIQSEDQILSYPPELSHVEKAIVPAPDDGTEQPESSKLVRPATEVWDNAEKENRLPLRDITTSMVVSETIGCLKPPSTPTVLASSTARMIASLQVANDIQRELEASTRTTTVMEPLLPSPLRKRKPSGEPLSQSAIKSATTRSPSESPTSALHRRPRTRRSAPHLAGHNKRQVVVTAQTLEGSAKRRRVRTASALGMENVAVAFPTATVDRNGQIVLPAGTGWKGRSLSSLTPSQLPVAPQRQRRPTLASESGAATSA